MSSQKIFCKEGELEAQVAPRSVGCRTDAASAGMEVTSIPHAGQSSRGPGALSLSSDVWKGVFLSSTSQRGLGKPCCTQMCWHPGFVFPFIEHGQETARNSYRSRTFRMVSEHRLQQKSRRHQPLLAVALKL